MPPSATEAPADALEIRPLTSAEAEAVPPLWDAAWAAAAPASSYALDPQVWRERLAQHHDPDLLLGAFANGALVGAVYGRVATAAWLPTGVGWLSAIAVAPPHQGRGVGTRLAGALTERLRARGCSVVRFGSEANHLLPGIPQEAPLALWRLAQRLGARFGNAEHDLLLDLHAELPPAPLASGWLVRDDDPDAALAFVERAFPGRWADEVRTYLDAGTTVLTLAPAGSTSAPVSARAEGFCVVFQGHERLRGPSLTWVARHDLLAGTGPHGRASGVGARLGGMGPLGVSAAARGRGLGLALVRAGAAWLAARGAEGAVVNWTTLTGFYGRLGARVWRTYQRAEAPLGEPHVDSPSASTKAAKQKAEAER